MSGATIIVEAIRGRRKNRQGTLEVYTDTILDVNGEVKDTLTEGSTGAGTARICL